MIVLQLNQEWKNILLSAYTLVFVPCQIYKGFIQPKIDYAINLGIYYLDELEWRTTTHGKDSKPISLNKCLAYLQ